MQVNIRIPFQGNQIVIRNQKSSEYIYDYVCSNEHHQSNQQKDKRNTFMNWLQGHFIYFTKNIQQKIESYQKESINSFNKQVSQTCEQILPALNKTLSSQSQLLSVQSEMSKLSEISFQQNMNWRYQQELVALLQKAINRLDDQISNIYKDESLLVQLQKQVQQNPLSHQYRQQFQQKKSKILKRRQTLKSYQKKLSAKISQVIKKKQNQGIKIRRSEIKQKFIQAQLAEVYLIHEWSLQKTEIQQLKTFNCTILKQIYLCGNQIGNQGFKILTQIPDLRNLKILDLQFNGITNIQKIQKLSHLEELYLADCQCIYYKQKQVNSLTNKNDNFMNILTLEHVCSVFKSSKWENLRFLSINFVKEGIQNKLNQNEWKLKKYWQPQEILEFLNVIILQDNKQNFSKLERVEYGCRQCFKRQNIGSIFGQVQEVFKKNKIQFKNID